MTRDTKYRLWQKNILLYLIFFKYPWGTKRMYLIAKENLQKGIIWKGDAWGDARRVTNSHNW